MKKIYFAVFLVSLFTCVITAQDPPSGESRFMRSMLNGGLFELREKIAHDKFDNVDEGFGKPDRTEVGGRIFLTSTQMAEIGEIKQGYSTLDYENALIEAFKKNLKTEGFQVGTSNDRLYLRYQCGSIVGFVYIRAFFLENGAYRLEFIFHESYIKQQTRKGR